MSEATIAANLAASRPCGLRVAWLLYAAYLVAASGCVTDAAHRYYAANHFPPTPVEDVEILREPPARPHEVIADLQARGASVKWMRKEAAKIGGHAVIVGTYGGYRSYKDEWAGQDKHADHYSRITGTVIRYEENNPK